MIIFTTDNFLHDKKEIKQIFKGEENDFLLSFIKGVCIHTLL